MEKRNCYGSPSPCLSPTSLDLNPSPSLQSLDPFYSEMDFSENHSKDLAELSPDQVEQNNSNTSDKFSLVAVEALMEEITSRVTAGHVTGEELSVEGSSSPQCTSPLLTH